MKTIHRRYSRGLYKALGITLFFLSVIFTQQTKAAGWTLSTSFSYNNGYYIYNKAVQTYYMNLGMRYNSGNLMISGYVPFIFQNDIFADSTPSDQFQNNHMVDDPNGHNYNSGIGDVFLYGEYRLLQPLRALPTVYVTAQVKIPTSASLSLFSTGEFDFGAGLALRQWFGTYYGFINGGYLYLGNPPGINYQNPFSFGIGAGKFFSHGRYSVNLYFRTYTEIIDAVEPPRQASLGFSAALSRGTLLSLYLIKGFGESSPDFAFTAGLEWLL